MFVIQRILAEGKLTLLYQRRHPHPYFGIFGTSNTQIGDITNVKSGTQSLNQGQLDRWNIFLHSILLNHTLRKK